VSGSKVRDRRDVVLNDLPDGINGDRDPSTFGSALEGANASCGVGLSCDRRWLVERVRHALP
jgi:hypothetical protein